MNEPLSVEQLDQLAKTFRKAIEATQIAQAEQERCRAALRSADEEATRADHAMVAARTALLSAAGNYEAPTVVLAC